MGLLGPRSGGRTGNAKFGRSGSAPRNKAAHVQTNPSLTEPNVTDQVQERQNVALQGVALHSRRGEVGTKDSQGRIDHGNITVNFTPSPAGGASPVSVTFTPTITGPYGQWLWDFDDGGATSTAWAPSHNFASPGTYDVLLTVWDYEHDRSFTKTVAVVVT